MPDIDIACPNCGKMITVSEYADLTAVKCRSCGSPLRVPRAPEPEEPEEQPVAVSQGAETFTEEPIMAQIGSSRKVVRKGRRRFRRKTGPSKMGTVHFVISWFIFILIAGVMSAFRYGNSLSASNLEVLKTLGPYIALGIHIFIVTRAYSDSMLQGILATFVPGYSFCFIIMGLDNYYIRAVLGGLLTGVAQDTLILCKDAFIDMLQGFGFWLERGVYD